MHCRPWPMLSAVLSHHPLAGVRRCPLALGHRLSAGLLVGVPDRRPVSPLQFSPSVLMCSGAGPARHYSGWNPSGSPVAPFKGSRHRLPDPTTMRRLLGRSAVCTGSPAACCCDSLGIHRVGSRPCGSGLACIYWHLV